MVLTHIFAPAQLVGYLALILGVSAFSQKNDQRLRLLSASQCIVYALHFYLLGNVPAAASATVSSARSFVSLRFRSPLLVVLFIGIILWFGARYVTTFAGLLPIISSCASTTAMFLCRGITMRVVLFCCTLLWLANNLICGSIGGTMLETIIGVINLSTIFRMLADRSKASAIATLKSDYCA